jgi:hypothetical protein
MLSSSLQDPAELVTCDCVGAVVGPGRPVIDLLPRRVEPAGRYLVDELGVDELQLSGGMPPFSPRRSCIRSSRLRMRSSSRSIGVEIQLLDRRDLLPQPCRPAARVWPGDASALSGFRVEHLRHGDWRTYRVVWNTACADGPHCVRR